MLNCLAFESASGGFAKVVVYSSLKKREAAAAQTRAPYWKLQVPDEAALRKMMAETHGDRVQYSKPQRRSIAWVDNGVRLTAHGLQK
jgi:hypothetical protein